MHIGEIQKRIIAEPIEETWQPAKTGDNPGELIPGEDEKSPQEEPIVYQSV